MLLPWAGLALGAGVAAFFLAPQGAWKVAAGVLGAVWIAARHAALRVVAAVAASGHGSFTAEMLGMTLAHFGVAVFLVGALLTEGLSQQRELAVAQGQTRRTGRLRVPLRGRARIASARTSKPTAAPSPCSTTTRR